MDRASLESGQKAWDALLAKKAAENMTISRNGDQRKSAPMIQGAGSGSCKGGRTAAAAAPNNGASAHMGGMASQSLGATAEASGEGNNRRTTPRESVKPPSKPSAESSDDLIDFGF